MGIYTLEEESRNDDIIPNALDDFIAHGTYTVSNSIGYEVQLSDCGTSARLRYGDDISPWIEITYEMDKDYDEPQSIINLWGGVPINQVSRIQN